MRPPLKELFRSTAFRIARIYSLLFVLALVVLLFVIYWNATAKFEQELRDQIVEETNELVALHRDKGTGELIRLLAQKVQKTRFYGLDDRSGTRLAGNYRDAAIKMGWYRIKIFEDLDNKKSGDTTPVILLGTLLSDGARLAVGISYQGTDDLADVILKASIWTLGLTGLLALMGGLIIYRASTRRVDMITQSSRDIMDGNLAHRLPLQGSGDELDRLSESINKMLERIEQLMGTMKQVTSDIAHDLRTPLSRLRQNLESARDSADTVGCSRTAFDKAISETDGILQTFNALLSIGQIEAGGAVKRFTDIDLSDLVARLAEGYRPVAEDHSQVLETEIEPGVHVRGNPELISQMIVNLIENALNHCAAGTRIVLGLKSASPAQLTVSDNGKGVAPEELRKILRPFYRLEQSRSSGGSGLGLALVNAIARLHGVHLDLADNRPGLKIVLTFPAGANTPARKI
jgi:signal transduction histidine kinase